MLVGSLLAELVAGRLGDRFVAESSRSPIGMWILKRNDRAPRIRDDVEDTEEERVPELRLIVGLVGVLFSIVSRFILLIPSTIRIDIQIRRVCYGLE